MRYVVVIEDAGSNLSGYVPRQPFARRLHFTSRPVRRRCTDPSAFKPRRLRRGRVIADAGRRERRRCAPSISRRNPRLHQEADGATPSRADVGRNGAAVCIRAAASTRSPVAATPSRAPDRSARARTHSYPARRPVERRRRMAAELPFERAARATREHPSGDMGRSEGPGCTAQPSQRPVRIKLADMPLRRMGSIASPKISISCPASSGLYQSLRKPRAGVVRLRVTAWVVGFKERSSASSAKAPIRGSSPKTSALRSAQRPAK